MKLGTVMLEFGWFGFGRAQGEFGGYCLGPVKVMRLRAGLEAWARAMRDALKAAQDRLKATQDKPGEHS